MPVYVAGEQGRYNTSRDVQGGTGPHPPQTDGGPQQAESCATFRYPFFRANCRSGNENRLGRFGNSLGNHAATGFSRAADEQHCPSA